MRKKQCSQKWHLFYRTVSVVLCLALIMGIIGPYHAKAVTQNRYIILVVDTSGVSDFIDTSTGEVVFSAVSPIDEVKQSAKNFAESLSMVEGANVAIVSYGDYAQIELPFTNSIETIKSSINGISMIGGRKNMEAALDIACGMLDGIGKSNAKKTVVLISPGMTDEGKNDYSGHWDSSVAGGDWYNLSSGINFYAYANSAYVKAEEIKAQGAEIYTIGLLKMMEDCPEIVKGPAELFQIVLRNIASEGGYYPVYDVNDFAIVFEEMANNVVYGSKGSFKFAAYGEGYDLSERYYFEDSYFEESAERYNASLATMSLCLSMAAFPSNESSKRQWENAFDLLNEIDFDMIEHNNYYDMSPQMNTMGVIAGYKQMYSDKEGDYTLIAVVTRGSNYYSEFGGNFVLGERGDHEGFLTAKVIVEEWLNQYVSRLHRENKIRGKVKLWMTGYSRGAATVNLLAGELTERKRVGNDGEITVLPQDLYAYCFETPKGLSVNTCPINKAKSFKNIHNIVNPNDIVPLVAMEDWGFIRYGVDEAVIPDPDKTAYYNQLAARMMECYTAFNTREVQNSYVHLSEYEEHFDRVVSAMKDDVRRQFSKEQESMEAFIRNFGRPKNFETEWNKVLQDLYDGKKTSTCDRTKVDFTEYKGYGIFSTVYEYVRGLNEMRRHCALQTTGLGSNSRVTDTVSCIDLFAKYDIGFPATSLLGLLQLINNHSSIDFSSLRKNNELFLSHLAKKIGNRGIYAESIEKGLSTLVYLVESESASYTGVIEAIADSADFEDILNGLGDVLNNQVTEQGLGRIYDLLVEYYETHGINLRAHMTDAQIATFKSGVMRLIQVILDGLTRTESSNVIWSLLMNIEKIEMAHFPELCLAWMKSQDSNYYELQNKVYFPKETRIVRINCPVDVVAKDSEGRIVAEIQDNIPKTIDGSCLTCRYTEDGEKLIYLPKDESYTLSISATGSGLLNISVNEYDESDNCSFIEVFQTVSIEKGDSITLSLPREFFVDEHGQTTIQGTNTLIGNNMKIQSETVLLDDDAKDAEYSVLVSNNNELGGICFGGGSYVYGAFAMVTATEFEDCLFVGWYEGDELVSSERQYRFPVKKDIELTAHFEGETQYGKKGVFTAMIESEEGGFILSEEKITALSDYPFAISAIPYVGYTFVRWECDEHCFIENPEEWETKAVLIDGDSVIRAVFEEESSNNDVTDAVVIEGVDVHCSVDNAWNGGYNGSITITNNSGQDISDWRLMFSTNNEIAGVWNGIIADTDNGEYCVKGYEWNNIISDGTALVIGFTAVGNSSEKPAFFRVLSEKATDTPVSECDITFVLTGEWNGGCTGEIVVLNNTQQTIHGWSLEFVCDGTVNNVWNGKVTRKEGNRYSVSDDGSYTVILPGGSARIGVNLSGGGTDFYPKEFLLQVQ